MREDKSLRDSWEWLSFAATLPAIPVPFTAMAANELLFSGRCVFMGVTYKNAATTAGTLALFDGQDATTAPLYESSPAASSPGGQWYGQPGVLRQRGVFAQVATVTLSGSVFVIPLLHYDLTAPGT